MRHHASWVLLCVLALSSGASSEVWPQAIEVASRGPRFIASWTASGEAVDVSTTVVLRRRLSLDLANITVDEALKEITRQADLEISYSKALLPHRTSVSLHVQDVTVAAALTEVLLDAGVDVAVARGGQMALVRRPASVPVPTADSGVVSGRVTDRATGSPIVGAAVVIEGTRHAVITGPDGGYRLADVAAGTYEIRARYIGYAPLIVSIAVNGGVEVIADFALERSVQLLEEVVTTGTLVPTEVKAVPTPVSVIRREDIELQRPHTVQQLFRRVVPGGVSWDIAARPEQAAFSVRGASTLSPGSSQMKVLVDGIEQAYATNSPVDPNSIERIEVIRGPQASAVYGSDAIGGVIQIFTKRGDLGLTRPQVEAGSALGILQTRFAGFSGVLRQNYNLSVRGGGPDVSYNVGAGYSRTGDWLPNGEISKQSSPSVYGGMHFARDVITVDISGRYSVQNNPDVVNPELSRTGFAYYSKPLYTTGEYTNQAVGVRLGLDPMPWLNQTLTMGVDRFAFEYVQSRPRLTTPEDTLLTVSSPIFSKQWIGYTWSVKRTLSADLSGSVTAGLDYYSAPQSSFSTASAISTTGSIRLAEGGTITAYRVSTNNTGYFAQAQLGVSDALFLTAGLRAEENSEFGDSLGAPVSPRLGFSYVVPMVGTTFKLRGSWGRAIRAPSPALKLSLGPSSLPNLELGPERQQGWDAGLDVAVGPRGSISVTYYDQTADNLIQDVMVQSTPVPLNQFQNVGRVENTGVEVEGSLTISRLQLNATYGYTRARIAELAPNYAGELRVGDQVHGTPRHTAGSLLTAALSARTAMTAGLTYVGRFSGTDFLALFRCFGGTGPCTPDFTFTTEYPGFTKVNVGLSQEITPNLLGYVSVDNLTNEDAVEQGNIFPAMGRISTLGLRFSH